MKKHNNDPSEQIENFRAIKEHNRLNKKECEIINTRAIKSWCETHNVHYKELQPYHLRLMQDTLTIDVFPQSKKYHNIKTNERGRITGKITDFLTQHFL